MSKRIGEMVDLTGLKVYGTPKTSGDPHPNLRPQSTLLEKRLRRGAGRNSDNQGGRVRRVVQRANPQNHWRKSVKEVS